MNNVTESHSSLAPGVLFAKRYRIECLLGEGGMGSVYLAEDTMFEGEKIALKVLHSHLSRDARHGKRFLREVQLTRKLAHSNVVRTYDVGNIGDNLFFTMEYVQGESLKERLAQGPLTPFEAPYILAEVASGLSAIHQLGIIHRDLKPANVILDTQGAVKITDFGVARTGCSDLTGTQEIVGSVTYVAPEVWLGREVSGSCDLYALGVMSYQMITGILPFDGETPAEVMCKHLEIKPTPPNIINEMVPSWLSNLIMSLLEKDPIDRPSSAQEVRAIIDANRTASGTEIRLSLNHSRTGDSSANHSREELEMDDSEPLSISDSFIRDTFEGTPPDLKPEDTMVTPTAEFAQTLAKVRAKNQKDKRKYKHFILRSILTLMSVVIVGSLSWYAVEPAFAKLLVDFQSSNLFFLGVIAFIQLLNISAVVFIPLGVVLGIVKGIRFASIWWLCSAVALASICTILSFTKVEAMLRYKNDFKAVVVGAESDVEKNLPKMFLAVRCGFSGGCS